MAMVEFHPDALCRPRPWPPRGVLGAVHLIRRASDSTLNYLGVTRADSQDLEPVRNLAPVSRQSTQEVCPL